jgi:hypothetical protein
MSWCLYRPGFLIKSSTKGGLIVKKCIKCNIVSNNFHKCSKAKDKMQSSCKTCKSSYGRLRNIAYPSLHKDRNTRLNNSEGVGVYIAIFRSGIYVGSGQIYKRRITHMSGSSDISKSLKEKATMFIVVTRANNKLIRNRIEQLVIDLIGMVNLLNKRRVSTC